MVDVPVLPVPGDDDPLQADRPDQAAGEDGRDGQPHTEADQGEEGTGRR